MVVFSTLLHLLHLVLKLFELLLDLIVVAVLQAHVLSFFFIIIVRWLYDKISWRIIVTVGTTAVPLPFFWHFSHYKAILDQIGPRLLGLERIFLRDLHDLLLRVFPILKVFLERIIKVSECPPNKESVVVLLSSIVNVENCLIFLLFFKLVDELTDEAVNDHDLIICKGFAERRVAELVLLDDELVKTFLDIMQSVFGSFFVVVEDAQNRVNLEPLLFFDPLQDQVQNVVVFSVTKI